MNLLHQRFGFVKTTVGLALVAVRLLFAAPARSAAQVDGNGNGVNFSGVSDQFSTPTVNVNQSDGTVALTVQLSAACTDSVTVQYATADGTATAPTYYTAASGTLIFAPGDPLTQQVTINLGTAVATNATASFTVTLSNSVNAIVGTNGTVTVTITNIPPPTVQFDVANYYVSQSSGTANVTVSLSAASASTVTVDYATSNGTATAGVDYVSASGTLTFTAGVTSQTVTVTILQNTDAATSSTVQLTLGNATNATLGTNTTGTLTIWDTPVVLTVTAASAICAGGLQSAPHQTVVTANLSDGGGNPYPNAKVTFSTSAGSLSPTSAKTDKYGNATTTLTSNKYASEGSTLYPGDGDRQGLGIKSSAYQTADSVRTSVRKSVL
jgi:hypothetical protein